MLLTTQAKMLAESMQGVMTKGEATELVKEKAEEVIGCFFSCVSWRSMKAIVVRTYAAHH